MKPQTDTDRIRVFAPAKINLCLHVGARRSDGYHDLQSLVVFADIGDELLIERNERLSLEVRGPFAEGLTASEDNLVMRAARLLCDASNIQLGARIVLDKHVPVASGIGGGSADAAAALRGMARLWPQAVDPDELITIAATLGSDVPMCLLSQPAWVEGRGEQITRLESMPGFALLLVNPLVQISTSDVFARLNARRGIGISASVGKFAGVGELAGYLARTSNDLETPAIEIAPVIRDVLRETEALPGVMLARMSGSGATCFGLFEQVDCARANAKALHELHPGWWVEAANLTEPFAGVPRAA